jgi:Arylsulfotransferase (ASST)
MLINRRRFLTRSVSAPILGSTALARLLDGAARAEPSVFPTSVTRYDPGKAYNCFILFSGGDDITHLIDMNGHEVHRWDYPGFPSGIIDPALTGGHRGRVMVELSMMKPNDPAMFKGLPFIYHDKSIGELDWGNAAPGGAAQQHHDWARLPNGNTLVLSVLVHPLPGFALPRLVDEAIYEVTPKGEIAWRWIAGEHLDEFGWTPQELAFVRAAKRINYLTFNDMKPVGPNRWFDAGDARFDPDNILVGSRNANFVAIIDKKSGKIVWRLGPDYPYEEPGPRKLPRPVDQISGQHDPQIIPKGLPGAGNLLLLDDQGEAGYPPVPLGFGPESGSRVLEIDPATKQIVWEYAAADSNQPGWTFNTSFIGAARRLPNGNTFIDEGMTGRFFQVTPAGEIVWEYVSPYVGKAPLGPGGRKLLANWVYRGQPVPYDWVPAGTPHSERAVVPPDLSTFHLPASR